MKKTLKKLSSATLTILMCLSFMLTGCGTETKKEDSSKSEIEENVGKDAETKYPLEFTDGEGNTTKIEKEPKTVISVAPSVTETLYAIGAEDKLIGRTDYDTYPEKVNEVESIGSLRNPNVEKIVELNPDLVIASTHFSEEVYDKLKDAGITVVVVKNQENLDGVYKSISEIANLVNKNEEATKVTDDMKDKIAKVKDKVKGLEIPSVYYVVSYGEGGDYTAGGDTFINELLTIAGGDNVAKDAEGWSYSIEKLTEQDPSIIICSNQNDAKKGIEAANGYKDLTAVKEGELQEIDNNLLDIAGPRVADGTLELAKLIHPEAFK